jgi:hypothetical protein
MGLPGLVWGKATLKNGIRNIAGTSESTPDDQAQHLRPGTTFGFLPLRLWFAGDFLRGKQFHTEENGESQ